MNKTLALIALLGLISAPAFANEAAAPAKAEKVVAKDAKDAKEVVAKDAKDAKEVVAKDAKDAKEVVAEDAKDAAKKDEKK